MSGSYKINASYKIFQLDLALSPLGTSNLNYDHLCYKLSIIPQFYPNLKNTQKCQFNSF